MSKPNKKRQKHTGNSKSSKERDGKIQITRQLRCDTLKTLTTIPACWTVPQPDEDVAYLLDLSDDTREWKDSSGELLSMAIRKTRSYLIMLNHA